MWARVIDGALELVAAICVIVAMPGNRAVATALVIFVVVLAYEAGVVAAAGTSIGKAVCGLKVVGLDRPEGRVALAAAIRRGVPIALMVVVAPGWPIAVAILAMIGVGASVVLSTHDRGAPDRIAGTVVAWRTAPAELSTAELESWPDPDNIAVWSPYGRLATLDERRRARTWRLTGDPWLLAWVVASAALLLIIDATVWWFLFTVAAWIVVFIVDETIRVARTGQTAGHRRSGLVVIDATTGRPPTTRHSLARATTLALFLYFLPPLGVPILALIVRLSDSKRGPHDHAGGTVVVAHPAVTQPEARFQMVAPTTRAASF